MVSALSLTTLATAAGLCIWQWGIREDLVVGCAAPRRAGARRRADRDLRGRGRDPDVAGASRPPPRRTSSPGTASSRRCSWLGARHDAARAGAEPDRVLRRARAALGARSTCCAARRSVAHSSLESGLKYLIVGSLGSATLLYGLSFIYGGAGSTDFNQIDRARSAPGHASDSAGPDGGRADRRPASPSRSRSRPSTSGRPTSTRAPPPRSRRSWRWRRRRRRSSSSSACFDVALGPSVDDWQPALAVLAAHLDRGREHRRDRPGLAEAAAGLLRRRAGRLHAGRRGRRLGARDQRAGLLPGGLHADEPGGVRGHRDPRARDALGRRHQGVPGPRPRPARARVAA